MTAFRPEMAVHGRYRLPCPVCATPIQRIVHSANETNYCPNCQTGGKLLADRALSPLLRKDWPSTVEAWEALRDRKRSQPRLEWILLKKLPSASDQGSVGGFNRRGWVVFAGIALSSVVTGCGPGASSWPPPPKSNFEKDLITAAKVAVRRYDS